ncbi:MAG: hypothetical protein P0S93_03670, partial [Candidatus Neptunochlamydia sp.]|nr:hypothetical protein [Candidatus Neptunochlamydia sp.]
LQISYRLIGREVKSLLRLSSEKTIITVDAMMTQTAIGATIIEQRGDYVIMALKKNQGSLFEDVELYFSEIELGMSRSRTLEKEPRGSGDWIDQKKDRRG